MKMFNRSMIAVVLASLMLALSPSTATAQGTQGAPDTLPVQGYLTDDAGTPYDGQLDVEFKLWPDSSASGTELFTYATTLEIESGVFVAYINGSNSDPLLPIVMESDDIHLTVAVDPEGDGSYSRLAGAIRVGAVPYAGYANNAGSVPAVGVNYKTTTGVVDVQTKIEELQRQVDMLNNRLSTAEMALNDKANSADVTMLEQRLGTAETDIASNTSAISANKMALNDKANSADVTMLEQRLNTEIGTNAMNIMSNGNLISMNSSSISTNATDITNIKKVTDLMSYDSNAKSLTIEDSANLEDVYFSSANVHVQSGAGSTDATVNGKGNLIVGYNEDAGSTVEPRGGSHNLVVGVDHSYTSYGGVVFGYGNSITADYASVSGGINNDASGDYSSVSGGSSNDASGFVSSVSGGSINEASGDGSSVSGGNNNDASGFFSSVSGGRYNKSSGDDSSVSGGDSNNASGTYSSVSGGSNNISKGSHSSVSGGGGASSTDGNVASGDYSSVSGGDRNNASGSRSSVSGGSSNDASGISSSVSGGLDNEASGFYSSLSGGTNRSVTGNNDWRAGSLFETQ